MNQDAHLASRPFQLMEGGPLFHLERRVGLIQQNAPFKKNRALMAALLTWLPLFVLSALQGRAFGHSVPVSFVRDFSTYTRFLLAVPLLVMAENIVGPRIAAAAAYFVTSGVVEQKDFQRFDNIVERTLRRRDSVLAEIVILIFAYVFSIIAFRSTAVLHVSTWYASRADGGTTLTWAGWWLLGFCVPLFQFLSFRWLWRLFIWFQFLGGVHKLDLQLFPTHPDQAAGLGFVGEAQRFFGVILFAFSLGATGVIANDVLYDKMQLKDFAPAIATYVVVMVIVVLAPLLLFAGTLLKTRREGLHEYGTLSTTYTREFHKKWIEGQNPEHDALLGTNDIQSLADLGNSYELVEKTKPIPIDPRTVIHLIVASLLPMVPLLLTVMPLNELLKLLMKVLM
jgi:hypothetical protein